MQTQSSFTILFWIKKSRIKNGKAAIYARVTINGRRLEISTQRAVSITEWDPNSQSLKGKSIEARMVNEDLAFIKAKILTSRSRIEMRNESITTESLKNVHRG